MLSKKQHVSQIEQDKRRELEFFDRHIAEHSDLDPISSEMYEKVLEELRLIAPGTNLKILDAGCGTGVWSLRLKRIGHSVTAIDMSHAMLKVAAKRFSRDDIPSPLIVGDIEALPLKEETFDLCFGGGVLHHFPSLVKALAEMKRVLKNGGRICFLEPNGSNPIMRLSYLLRVLLDYFIRSSGRHASVNERTHRNDFYESQCGRYWQTVRISPIYIRLERNPSHKGWFRAGIAIRNGIMDVVHKTMPRRLGCNFILVVGE